MKSIFILIFIIGLYGCASKTQPSEKKGLVMQLTNNQTDTQKNIDVGVFNFTVEEKK